MSFFRVLFLIVVLFEEVCQEYCPNLVQYCRKRLSNFCDFFGFVWGKCYLGIKVIPWCSGVFQNILKLADCKVPHSRGRG